MPIYVQTPNGFIYTSTALPFGGVHMAIKGNQFNLISSDDNEEEEDIYDACKWRFGDSGTIYMDKICINEWEVNEDKPWKFEGTGWYDEHTDSFMDFVDWYLAEVIDTDKWGNPTRAIFRHR